MIISLFYELDKYANTKSINLSVFKKYFSFVRECKKQYPQNKEFLDIIKNTNDSDYKKFASVDNLISELGIDYIPNTNKKWHVNPIFDYINLLFPNKYNWITYTFFEVNIEKGCLIFTILGIGIDFQKY